jgi:hypothetical protein
VIVEPPWTTLPASMFSNRARMIAFGSTPLCS